MSSADSADEAVASLRDLHDEIDAAAKALEKTHARRMQCRRGCSACCLDDLTVTQVEAERVRRAHSQLLRDGQPHPPGACAFLDGGGACRIYDDRPYVCRSQGLPLRVVFENEADEIEERRDICPLNLDGGPALDLLDEDDCWLVGPFELRLGQIDEKFGGAERGRVALRTLFDRDRSE